MPQGSQGPSEVRYRAHVAFSTAYDLVKNLEKVQNRRKALVFVSNGYDAKLYVVYATTRPGAPRRGRQVRCG